MKYMLDFERPLLEMEEKIAELKKFSDREKIDVNAEVAKLEQKALSIQKDIFSRLTPWQRVRLARHPDRPHSLDYIRLIGEGFVELHGDRRGGDDPALIGGPARFEGKRVFFIGHQKERSSRKDRRRGSAAARPEGYRKAYRLMKLAAKFQSPVILLIDTPGLPPGIAGEEGGLARAIADNL